MHEHFLPNNIPASASFEFLETCRGVTPQTRDRLPTIISFLQTSSGLHKRKFQSNLWRSLQIASTDVLTLQRKDPSPDLWLLREVLVRVWCAHELWRILCCRVIPQSRSDPRATHVRNLYGGTEIVSWHSSRPTAQVCSSNEDVLFPSFQSGHSGPHWTQCTTRASTCRTSSTPMQGWLDSFTLNLRHMLHFRNATSMKQIS